MPSPSETLVTALPEGDEPSLLSDPRGANEREEATAPDQGIPTLPLLPTELKAGALAVGEFPVHSRSSRTSEPTRPELIPTFSYAGASVDPYTPGENRKKERRDESNEILVRDQYIKELEEQKAAAKARADQAEEREATEKAVRIRAEYDATHDELTGAYNRAGFFVYGKQFIGNLKPGEGVVCLLGDLDKFKEVNDSSGHAEGDKVLINIAQIFEKLLGNRAIVARLGGDEFALLVSYQANSTASKTAIPTEVADLREDLVQVVEALSEEYRGAHPESPGFGISLGMSLPRDEGLHPSDIDTILEEADVAMYDIKGPGRHSHVRHASR